MCIGMLLIPHIYYRTHRWTRSTAHRRPWCFLSFNGCGCCLKPIFTMELTLMSFLCDSTCLCHAKVCKYVFLLQREVDFQGFWIWRNYLGSAIFCRRPCIQSRYSSAARNFFGLVVPRLCLQVHIYMYSGTLGCILLWPFLTHHGHITSILQLTYLGWRGNS